MTLPTFFSMQIFNDLKSIRGSAVSASAQEVFLLVSKNSFSQS